MSSVHTPFKPSCQKESANNRNQQKYFCLSSFLCCGLCRSESLSGHRCISKSAADNTHVKRWGGGLLSRRCIQETNSYCSCPFLNDRNLMILNSTFYGVYSEPERCSEAHSGIHLQLSFLHKNKLSLVLLQFAKCSCHCWYALDSPVMQGMSLELFLVALWHGIHSLMIFAFRGVFHRIQHKVYLLIWYKPPQVKCLQINILGFSHKETLLYSVLINYFIINVYSVFKWAVNIYPLIWIIRRWVKAGVKCSNSIKNQRGLHRDVKALVQEELCACSQVHMEKQKPGKRSRSNRKD